MPITFPHCMEHKGSIHPISLLIREINSIFYEMGFTFAEGPEIETEWYNFDALNIPKHHPARDMQDTFWVDPEKGALLRTHTSPVQIRYMETHTPPIRIIVPGKVFRNEATDATHEAQFFQLEGLMVEEGVTLGHLKGVLGYFFEKLLGSSSAVRLRSNYFAYVEPGVEVDGACFNCSQKGCRLCKYTGWIELMGAGMVHPKVLETAGIDPKRYSGFAFGGGIERLALLKFGIDDVRSMYSGDLRMVNQF